MVHRFLSKKRPALSKKTAAASTSSKGQQMEELAARYLKRQGLRLIKQNYHCQRGEIDLIMSDGDTLVFVEVRFRKQSAYGSAAESVSYRKQQKLLLAAQHFLVNHPQFSKRPARFDVIALQPDAGSDKLAANWLKNAFDEN